MIISGCRGKKLWLHYIPNIKTPIPQQLPRNAGWEIIVGMDYDNNNNNLILEIVSHISNYYPDIFYNNCMETNLKM